MRLYHANGGEIFAAARGDLDEVFGFGEPVAELNTDAFEAPLAVSLDECVLFFQSGRAGHAGLSDVWKAQRPE